MSDAFIAARGWIVQAVAENPVIDVIDAELADRLADPDADCSFEEMGFDSLARMELSIWLQAEHGIELDEAAILDHPSVNALARHVARGMA